MLKKLKSKIITKMIAGSSFFNSLINIIPGFHFIIYLGKCIELAKENPDVTYIIDSPATGHFISLFESTGYFAEIVKTGQIFNDLKTIQDKLKDPSFLNIHLVTIPEKVAFSESLELSDRFSHKHNIDLKLIINHSYLSTEELIETKEELPLFLKHKLEVERDIRAAHFPKVHNIIPYFFEPNFSLVLSKMTSFLKK